MAADVYITINEVANMLDVIVTSAYRIVNAQNLPFTLTIGHDKLGRQRYVRVYLKSACEDYAKTYINRMRVKPLPREEFEYSRNMRLDLIRHVHHRITKAKKENCDANTGKCNC